MTVLIYLAILSIAVVNFRESFYYQIKKYHFYSRSASQINECEVLFFCTPEGYCLENVSKYFDGKKIIIDLSPDFRIKDSTLYKNGIKDHTEPQLLVNPFMAYPSFIKTN